MRQLGRNVQFWNVNIILSSTCRTPNHCVTDAVHGWFGTTEMFGYNLVSITATRTSAVIAATAASIDYTLLVWKLWKKLGVLKWQADKSVTDYKPTKKEVHKDKCGCSRHPLSSRKQKQQQNKHKLVIISRNLAVNYFSHFSLVSWEYFPLLANISSFCRSALGYPFPSRLYLI